jgi:hypothetical protein
MDNLTIGQNISKFRKLKDLKASDIASQLGSNHSVLDVSRGLV